MSWHATAAGSITPGQGFGCPVSGFRPVTWRSHQSIFRSGSPGYLIRGCWFSSLEAAGLFSGTSTTWMTPWSGLLGLPGSSSYGFALFWYSGLPHVGPGRSGYDDTYTSSLGLRFRSTSGHAVMVWAPQSVYTAFTCWMLLNGVPGNWALPSL